MIIGILSIGFMSCKKSKDENPQPVKSSISSPVIDTITVTMTGGDNCDDSVLVYKNGIICITQNNISTSGTTTYMRQFRTTVKSGDSIRVVNGLQLDPIVSFNVAIVPVGIIPTNTYYYSWDTVVNNTAIYSPNFYWSRQF
jgi:hypothetical protein